MSHTNPADATGIPLTAVELATRLSDLAVATVEQELSNDSYSQGRYALERQWANGIHGRLGQGISESTHERIFYIAHLAGKGSSTRDNAFYQAVEDHYKTLVETIQLANQQ